MGESSGRFEVGSKCPTGGETETAGGARSWKPLDMIIRTEVDYSPNPGHGFAGARSILVHRIHGIVTKESAAARRLASTLSVELTGTRDESLARQRTPVGYPFDDEQWGDRLFSRLSESVRKPQSWEATNLDFREDDQEGTRGITVCDPQSEQHQ